MKVMNRVSLSRRGKSNPDATVHQKGFQLVGDNCRKVATTLVATATGYTSSQE
jgi:hypothetical protein